MQFIAVFVAIIIMYVLISIDRESGSSVSEIPTIEKAEYLAKTDFERARIITFDIIRIKGDLLNIARRSFRESLKTHLKDSLKFKVSYNPHVKMIISFDEHIVDSKKYITKKNDRKYYVVSKKVNFTIEYALYKDSQTTYFIDKFQYRADIRAGSFSNYEDAIYKIDKKLYWILGKKIANRLVSNYKTILHRVRYWYFNNIKNIIFLFWINILQYFNLLGSILCLFKTFL